MLQEIALAPPLNGLLAVGLLVGLHVIARAVARASGDGGPLDLAAAFVCVVFALAAVIGAGALVPGSLPWWPRVVGVPIIAVGAWGLRGLPAWWGALRSRGRGSRPALMESVSRVVVNVVLAAAVALALAPPTDADSMSYHLAVPLDWMRMGSIIARDEWLHARLVGLGEHVILLGLCLGIDNLWALLQAWTLVLVVRAAASSVPGTAAEFVRAWIACTPVLLFLVPSQKPQLLPALATTLAVMLLLSPALSTRVLLLLAFLLGGAVACKASFVLTAWPLVAWTTWRAWKEQRMGSWLARFIAAGVVLCVPLWWRHAFFYGDPLPPMLERLREHPRADVVNFSQYLRNYGGKHGPAELLQQAWRMVVPLSPSQLPLVVGVALWGVAFARGPVLWACLAACGGVAVLGQLGARFFVEPAWWAGLAVARAAPSRVVRGAWGVLLLQGGAVAAGFMLAVGTLSPGALTPAQRDRVMREHASGYETGMQLDAAVPADALLVVHTRYHAPLPRPFVAVDRMQMGAGITPAAWARMTEHRGPVLLVDGVNGTGPRGALAGCVGERVGGDIRSREVFRNPLREPRTGTMAAYLLNLRAPGCNAGSPRER